MRPRCADWRLGAVALVVLLAGFSVAQADFEQGMSYLRADKFMEAASEFQVLVDEHPDYADGYHLLGICFMQVNKLAEAETNLAKAIELNPDMFEYRFNLAKAYQMQQRYKKVVATLNNAQGLAGPPHQLSLYKMRGHAQAMQKKWAEAIEDLEKAKKMKPEGSTLTQLGKAYFSLGYNDKAVANLREAAKADPQNKDVHKLLAEGLILLGAEATNDSQKKSYYSQALTEAETLAKLDPGSTDALYLAARSALGSGNYDKALDSLAKVLAKKPGHCNAMANQGKAFIAKKDWANALEALNNATACKPGMQVAWENKGFVLQKMKRYEEAIAAYRKALEIKPSSSIESAINICRQNIEVRQHNQDAARQEAEQQAKINAEAARVAEEERKAKEWEERTKSD